MARKRRRNSRKKLLPAARASIVAICLSVFELAVLFVSVFHVFGNTESINKVLASVGTVCIFISFIDLIVSFKVLFIHQYNIGCRVIAVLLSIATLLLWIGVYTIGLISFWA